MTNEKHSIKPIAHHVDNANTQQLVESDEANESKNDEQQK
jgi:hypothetical protein